MQPSTQRRRCTAAQSLKCLGGLAGTTEPPAPSDPVTTARGKRSRSHTPLPGGWTATYSRLLAHDIGLALSPRK